MDGRNIDLAHNTPPNALKKCGIGVTVVITHDPEERATRKTKASYIGTISNSIAED